MADAGDHSRQSQSQSERQLPSWNVEKRKPMTERGQRSRLRLADSGQALFREHRYAEVTIARIAEDAGMSVGSFYTYFETKEDLFLEILSGVFVAMYEEARHAWQHDRDFYENLVSTTRRYLTSYHAHRQIIRSGYELAASNEAIRNVLWGWRRDIASMMLPRLIQDQQQSDATPLEPTRLMRVFGAMVDGYAKSTYSDGEFGPLGKEDIEPASEIIAGVWYRAIVAAEEPAHHRGRESPGSADSLAEAPIKTGA